jgi:UDP-2,3-diacylglucosamine pyrophosphatase LpxH
LPITLYIISDLHLGGAAPGDGSSHGFQMCPPEARRRLVALFTHIRATHSPNDARLIVNGDFVDFLAEPVGPAVEGKAVQFAAFTADESIALARLDRAIQNTDGEPGSGHAVFAALGDLVRAGYPLTIIIGNHDLELSLPAVRRELHRRLTGGAPHRLEWLLDGEAWTQGPVLIEHGNRYDEWNWVDHGALRRLRAQISRAEVADGFEAPTGSVLVERVMNPLKQRYQFVDLLKPETEAVFPVLAALEPVAVGQLALPARLAATSLADKRSIPTGRPPREEAMVSRLEPSGIPAGGPTITTGCSEARLALAVEAEQSSHGVPREAVGVSWLASATSLWRLSRSRVPNERLDRLYEAFVAFRGRDERLFHVDHEIEPYRSQAERLASSGRVVVMGHTHVPKNVRFASGRYLNSGSWCPLIRVPAGLDVMPVKDRREVLGGFLADLCQNRLEAWCRLTPTFVRIVLDGAEVAEADLFEMTPNGPRRMRPDEVVGGDAPR